MRSLDLFTGYGGLTLALHEWCEPIAYVEIEEYAQRIIAERMADGSLPRAPILADVQNVQGEVRCCDIIVGGFPCQDLSVAGNREGLGGKRSGLFFEIARLTKEIQPSFIFLENVPAIRTRGLWAVAKEFTSLGYDCRWTSVSAGYVGAPHKRERWFLLAHAKSHNGRTRQIAWDKLKNKTKSRDNGEEEPMAYAGSKRLEGWQGPESAWETLRQCGNFSAQDWFQGIPKPAICRGANGRAFRVDRIKALGNGVVPEQARRAFRYLMGDLI